MFLKKIVAPNFDTALIATLNQQMQIGSQWKIADGFLKKDDAALANVTKELLDLFHNSFSENKLHSPNFMRNNTEKILSRLLYACGFRNIIYDQFHQKMANSGEVEFIEAIKDIIHDAYNSEQSDRHIAQINRESEEGSREIMRNLIYRGVD